MLERRARAALTVLTLVTSCGAALGLAPVAGAAVGGDAARGGGLTKAGLRQLDYESAVLTADDFGDIVQVTQYSSYELGRGYVLGEACGESLDYGVVAGQEANIDDVVNQRSITTSVRAFAQKSSVKAWGKLRKAAQACRGEFEDQGAQFAPEESSYEPTLPTGVQFAQITSRVPSSGLVGEALVHDVWFRSGQFIAVVRATSYEIGGQLTPEQDAALMDTALQRFDQFLSSVR